MSTTQVIIVGGHGKVALRLSKLLANDGKHAVTSIICTEDHIPDLKAISPSIQPLLLSLEANSTSDFAKAFTGKDVVVFAAGSGSEGTLERITKIDAEGAIKVFDAIEAVPGTNKPRLVLIGSSDSRDHNAPPPPHYDQGDLEMTKMNREMIGPYLNAKYLADKNLAQRTAFKWTTVRPGWYTDEPGTGKASVGRTHLSPSISRDDVALALSILVDRPDASGLAIDIVGGDEKTVAEGLDAFIARGQSDFLG
ncbi:unnamed protein product [Peniophora sp. CBMAI 1063]|nr:unnamed protein product [Peniophora sp. CBMAI 1063]